MSFFMILVPSAIWRVSLVVDARGQKRIFEVNPNDALIKRIVAGEVLIEDLGNGVVAAEGLSEAEIAELEANGFDIQRGG